MGVSKAVKIRSKCAAGRWVVNRLIPSINSFKCTGSFTPLVRYLHSITSDFDRFRNTSKTLKCWDIDCISSNHCGHRNTLQNTPNTAPSSPRKPPTKKQSVSIPIQLHQSSPSVPVSIHCRCETHKSIKTASIQQRETLVANQADKMALNSLGWRNICGIIVLMIGAPKVKCFSSRHD